LNIPETTQDRALVTIERQ